jgi:hypothetical protein
MLNQSARRIQGGETHISKARHLRNARKRHLLFEALEGRTLLSSVPIGVVQTLNLTTVSGWVYNADAGANPLDVVITVNGTATTITADQPRPDLLTRLGSANHGFTFAMPDLHTGVNTVNVTLLDPSTNYTASLKTATLNIATPAGTVNVLNSTVISGWAYSAAESGDPIQVVITLDGSATTLTANLDRSDLVAKVGSANHAFTFAVPDLVTGTHTVTVDAIDPSTGVAKRLRSGSIVIAPPSGSVTAMNSSVISGWAYSAANGGAPLQVLLTINGNQFAVQSDQTNASLISRFGSADHAFAFATPALKPGPNQVTIDAIDSSTGLVKRIRAGNINIGGPTGRVEVFNRTTISGWALSPLEGGAAVNVVITVNGQAHTVVANAERTDLVKKYGSAFHGFSYTLEALPPGKNTITVDVVDPFSGKTRRLKSGTITNPLPRASVSIHTATELTGWVSDPDSASPLQIQIKVDGVAPSDPFTADNTLRMMGVSGIGFDVQGDFAGKVVEIFAYDQPSNLPVLVWTNNHKAKGAITTISQYSVTGWAVDPDAPNTPVTVRVDIDGQTLTTAVANLARADVQTKAGALNVGYSVDIPGLTPGSHVIKVYALDGQASVAAPVLLGSKTVYNAPPVGNVDTATATVISGWALDRDLGSAPCSVNIYVDDAWVKTVVANLSRPDLTATYGSPNHGFSVDLPALTDGSHSITVTALDNRISDQQEVVIFDDFINNHAPMGAIEQVTGISITGWANDEDTTNPIAVDVYLDGVYYTHVVADQPDAAAPVANRGFVVSLPTMSFGTHTIDLYASESQGNIAVLFGSQTIANDRPIGVVESVSATSISGWAADPNRLGESVQIQVYVNGALAASGTASESRTDLLQLAPLNSLPSFSDYGFTLTLPTLSAGANQIDIYAVDLNNSQLSSLGSMTVTI